MIPKYNDIMLPLLKLISNGEFGSTKDVVNKLSEFFRENHEFKMNDDELKQTLQDGTFII